MNIVKTAVLGFALAAGPAFADSHATGDAAAGEKVFAKCKACHSIVDAGGDTIVKGGRTGPNLYGIYTRVAGADEDFASKYGSSMIEAGEAGLAWNEQDFIGYVQDPRASCKTTLMTARRGPRCRSNCARKMMRAISGPIWCPSDPRLKRQTDPLHEAENWRCCKGIAANFRLADGDLK